ncbi:putative serine/threonine-protein kinase [Phytophthora citrophthora]|uniref:Serine/threonine-protein kinase n=1 Tax=Phytophthora citrophthora TaxID=4793 RepID=A0AAD9GK21_9STRA|nr:putative serine/threonine-protein kinase [Phytophthora citrophthora]
MGHGNSSAKLCDFGLASLASHRPKPLSVTEISALGAIRWKAPEVLLGSGPTFASDIYSLGMCFIELLTGEYPWGTTMLDSVVKHKVTKQKMLPPFPEKIDDKGWNLITRMCCFDPEHRIKIGTVVNVVSEVLTLHYAGIN